jgi:hypothetical protein
MREGERREREKNEREYERERGRLTCHSSQVGGVRSLLSVQKLSALCH